jgi:hypothetical protein
MRHGRMTFSWNEPGVNNRPEGYKRLRVDVAAGPRGKAGLEGVGGAGGSREPGSFAALRMTAKNKQWQKQMDGDGEDGAAS